MQEAFQPCCRLDGVQPATVTSQNFSEMREASELIAAWATGISRQLDASQEKHAHFDR